MKNTIKMLFLLTLVLGFTNGSFAYAAASDALKLGGFVDAGFSWANVGNNNSFGVNDGALYLSKGLDGGEVFVDLPFSGGLRTGSTFIGTTTVDATTHTGTVSGALDNANDSNFTIGANKAQAYLAFKYENGISWKIGQFDSLLAYEANDLVDVMFTRGGLMGAQLPALVHTGGTIGVNYDPFFVDVFVANPANKAQMSGNIADYGLKVKFNSKMLWMNLGFWQNQNTGGGTNVTYLSYGGGLSFGQLEANLDLLFRKTVVSTALGWQLNTGYHLTDQVCAGIRAELLNRFANHQQISFTAGPQYKLTRDMSVKLDGTAIMTKTIASASLVRSYSAGVAGIYSF